VIYSNAPPEEGIFSLYGYEMSTLGPGISVFAAQPMANRGLFVLSVEETRVDGVWLTPQEPGVFARAYEASIRHLSRLGLIDEKNVGLVGFSRTGWYVLYALTHSEVPYAAAVVSDNADASYIQAAVSGFPVQLSEAVGGEPLGQGLQAWLENAPAFSADRLITPLRLNVESGGLRALIGRWEMYALLRHLNAPAEIYVVPDIEHGSHALQRPSQLAAAQTGAVDWFDFWLNGNEDLDPRKTEQYTQWRRLLEQRNAMRETMRPPLLRWNAVPATRH
jgi:hypothetical protein